MEKSMPRRHIWLSAPGYSSKALLRTAESGERMDAFVVCHQDIQEAFGLKWKEELGENFV
jgi:hypothetical protein